jgi:hypothetical protein
MFKGFGSSVLFAALASTTLLGATGCTAHAYVAEPVYATPTYVEPVRPVVYEAPPPPVVVERPVVVARPVIVERPAVVATRVYTPSTVVVQPRARVVVEPRARVVVR